MNWTTLQNEDQLDQIKEESNHQPVMIFKHSTTCNISKMVLARIERSWNPNTPVKPYFLDLRSFRSVSNQVAKDFDVEHESPQMIVIRDGKPVHVSSHMAIDVSDIMA